MSERDRNKEVKKGIEETKEKRAKEKSVTLEQLLISNKVSINGKVISQKEKEFINEIIEYIYDMDWNQEDARMKMMFDMSLIIDALKKSNS